MGTHGVVKRREAVHSLWREQPGLLRGLVVDILTALVFGALLATGGYQRTQATAWDVVNANGGPKVWGLVLGWLGVALLITAMFGRLVCWVMWTLALYYLVLGIAFFVAVWQDPTHGASYIGCVLMARCAVMHVSRADVYRQRPAAWTG